MTYAYDNGARSVSRDGVAWATIEPLEPTRGAIHVLDQAQELEYRAYGPFRYGYNLGIFAGDIQRVALAWDWHEGALVFAPGLEPAFGFDGRLTQGTRIVARTFARGPIVRVVVQDDVSPLDEDAVALLLLIDIQWTAGILLFDRRRASSGQ